MTRTSAIDPTRHGLTLVTGATGKVGRRVAARLEAAGVRTRLASRSSAPSFDWDDASTWDAALDGVTAAFVSYAPDLAVPAAPATIAAFTERAVAAGVRRLVLLSGRGEEEARRCEQIVQGSGIEWTVVRCAWFDQNFSEGEFLGMVLDGTVALPGAEIPEPFVDVDDIADVAAAALLDDRHSGEIYEVTGPRLLTLREAVAEISRAAGREIRYVPLTHEAFRAGLADAGVPDDFAWLLDYLFATVLDGRNAYVTDGVERALGRPARDFRDYAERAAKTGIWQAPVAARKSA